jgi:hypothetical protein
VDSIRHPIDTMTSTPTQRSSFLRGLLRQQGLLTLGTFAIALLCFGTASCSSTGKAQVRDNVPPMRVMMRDFGGGFDLVILNDAWLVKQGIEGATPRERKTSFQSLRLKPEDSTAKVYEDGVLDAYVQYIENELDLKKFMITGQAERVSVSFSTALEITEGNSVRHMGGGKNVQATLDEKKRYWNARKAFTDIYNLQYSLQAVEDPYGSGDGQP